MNQATFEFIRNYINEVKVSHFRFNVHEKQLSLLTAILLYVMYF